MEPKYIKDWNELKKETSLTHTLEIKDYCGWVYPINNDAEKRWKDGYYLSTHTFYGSNFEHSTKILQSRGFNVVLANWDKLKV